MGNPRRSSLRFGKSRSYLCPEELDFLSLAPARQNAVRHGLTAETVIDALEDAEDYAAFEMAVTTDYDAL
jgi:hypothetical protein